MFNGRSEVLGRYAAWPSTPQELQGCVDRARKSGMSVSIRGGGHGIAGRALSGDLIIDMRKFRNMTDSGETVKVGAGCTWAELDHFGASRGWVVPGGTVSTTGVAGLALGGGVGWLLPTYGLTCDSLVGLKGVTGLAEDARIDDAYDAVAMKLARGFGHGWLAIHEFEFVHHPLPTRIEFGSIEYREEDAYDVLHALSTASGACPDSINWSPALIRRSDRSFVSVDGMSFGSISFGDWIRSVCPVTPSSTSFRTGSYCDLQRMLDNPARWGQRSAWRSLFVRNLPDEAIAELVRVFEQSKVETLQIFVERMTGVVKGPRFPSDFALRDANFDILMAASWSDPGADRASVEWLDDAKEAILSKLAESAFSATYSNYAAKTERVIPSGVRASLDRVIERYDPDRLFKSCY
ncbi:FAD-binding protein [Dermatophilaceae bacterium Soc4.6]